MRRFAATFLSTCSSWLYVSYHGKAKVRTVTFQCKLLAFTSVTDLYPTQLCKVLAFLNVDSQKCK